MLDASKSIGLAILFAAALLALVFAWYTLYVCLRSRNHDVDWVANLEKCKARPSLETRIWRVLTQTSSAEASPTLTSKPIETDWVAYQPTVPYAPSAPLLSFPDFPPLTVQHSRSQVKLPYVPARTSPAPLKCSPSSALYLKSTHGRSHTPNSVCCNPATYSEHDLVMARYRLDAAFADLQARFGSSCESLTTTNGIRSLSPNVISNSKVGRSPGKDVVAVPQPVVTGFFNRV